MDRSCRDATDRRPTPRDRSARPGLRLRGGLHEGEHHDQAEGDAAEPPPPTPDVDRAERLAAMGVVVVAVVLAVIVGRAVRPDGRLAGVGIGRSAIGPDPTLGT